MARGRLITRRIGKSKKIANLKSDRSRFLYCVIYTHADCEGKFFGDPEEIKQECLGLNLRYSTRKVAESVIDMANVGLLILYEHEKVPFIQFIDFKKNQPGIRLDREAPSSIPSPHKSQINSRVTPSLYLKLKLNISKLSKVKEEIYFSFEERKFFNIKIEDKAGWLDAYPAVDIEAQLRIMREWLLANPSKKKSNYRQFINNWLNREQNKGGSQKPGKPYYMSKRDRDAKEIDALAKEYPPLKEEKK